MSRETGKVVRAIEPILKLLIEAQKQDPKFELNNCQKVEVAIFQQLLKNFTPRQKAGWYDIRLQNLRICSYFSKSRRSFRRKVKTKT